MALMDKPMVVEKFRKFQKYIRKNDGKIGTAPRIIDLSYTNICNFKCEHCFTRAPQGDNANQEMALDVIERIADEAHKLGIYEFDLQGGEILLFPEKLFQLIKAIKPERFYLYITTNGYCLDREMAVRLKEARVDRVSVSIDSMNAKRHDEFRGKEGAFEHAIQALQYVKEVGMEPFLNVTVGHYNALSEDLEDLLKYSKESGYTTLLNIASPSGNWQGKDEVMLNQQDWERVNALKKKYGNITRDLWNPFDRDAEKCLGCNAVNILYITPIGDVLACPLLHIKIGNIYEQSLKEIVEFGFRIKYFREFQERCLTGEDEDFVNKFLCHPMSVLHPADAKELFSEEDFI